MGGCSCVCVCASKEGGCTPNKANQLMCSGTTPRGKLRAKATSHSPSSLNHRPSGQSYSPKQHKTQWVCTHIMLISHAAPSTSHVSVAVATITGLHSALSTLAIYCLVQGTGVALILENAPHHLQPDQFVASRLTILAALHAENNGQEYR